MQELRFQTLDGDTRTLSADTLAAFATGISGGVVAPGDERYDEAREVWNGMIDRHPALIVRCRSEQDVCHAVRFAHRERLLTSVRGGGHHIAGNSMAERGLVIDLSAMREIRVQPGARRAEVGPGATLGELDKATQAEGLAVPLGINSTTGVAGLCLGGGFGWLSRRFGLTCDNLQAARLVTADGQVRHLSATENPELFWAIRGGGGNFGVVTQFDFALHPVGPEVFAGLVVYSIEEAWHVLHGWRDFCASAPDELSVWAVMRRAPALPFLPPSVHGEKVVVLAFLHSGDIASARADTQPLLGFGHPLGSMTGSQPYAGFQAIFDPLLAPGARNYWKSHNIAKIGEELIDILIDAVDALPAPECEVFVAQLGGQVGRVPVSATAYAGRDANFVMNIHGRWRLPVEDDAVRDWTRAVFADVAPLATGGGYVNFLTEDELSRTRSAYGANFERLQAIKRDFDPDNLFRMNLNIQP